MMQNTSAFLPLIQTVSALQPKRLIGRVSSVKGLAVRAEGIAVPIGGLVRIDSRLKDAAPAFGEVIAADMTSITIMLFTDTSGLSAGDHVSMVRSEQSVSLSHAMVGRILNGLGRPIDGLGPMTDLVSMPILPKPMSSMDRVPISEPISTGVRAIDAMATVGKGQRMGIFAGPGVGKSTLLGSIARHTAADVSVIALIGERGREVREFIEHTLGPEGLARSVVVVATGDESPLMRLRAAMVAASAAEFLRGQGCDVMLIMDSITRFCQAQRQVGLAAGEPPATKGYTPSVFALLPLLLERAGTIRDGGSITGFYAILVEGDDMTEPISDACRGILDGHLALTRRLANRGHFPAIDVLDSVSRVATSVSTPNQNQARRQITRLLTLFAEVEELLNIGAYVRGSNPEFDVAIEFKPRIDQLLQQSSTEKTEMGLTLTTLVELAAETGHALANASHHRVGQRRAI